MGARLESRLGIQFRLFGLRGRRGRGEARPVAIFHFSEGTIVSVGVDEGLDPRTVTLPDHGVGVETAGAIEAIFPIWVVLGSDEGAAAALRDHHRPEGNI